MSLLSRHHQAISSHIDDFEHYLAATSTTDSFVPISKSLNDECYSSVYPNSQRRNPRRVSFADDNQHRPLSVISISDKTRPDTCSLSIGDAWDLLLDQSKVLIPSLASFSLSHVSRRYYFNAIYTILSALPSTPPQTDSLRGQVLDTWIEWRRQSRLHKILSFTSSSEGLALIKSCRRRQKHPIHTSQPTPRTIVPTPSTFGLPRPVRKQRLPIHDTTPSEILGYIGRKRHAWDGTPFSIALTKSLCIKTAQLFALMALREGAWRRRDINHLVDCLQMCERRYWCRVTLERWKISLNLLKSLTLRCQPFSNQCARRKLLIGWKIWKQRRRVIHFISYHQRRCNYQVLKIALDILFEWSVMSRKWKWGKLVSLFWRIVNLKLKVIIGWKSVVFKTALFKARLGFLHGLLHDNPSPTELISSSLPCRQLRTSRSRIVRDFVLKPLTMGLLKRSRQRGCLFKNQDVPLRTNASNCHIVKFKNKFVNVMPLTFPRCHQVDSIVPNMDPSVIVRTALRQVKHNSNNDENFKAAKQLIKESDTRSVVLCQNNIGCKLWKNNDELLGNAWRALSTIPSLHINNANSQTAILPVGNNVSSSFNLSILSLDDTCEMNTAYKPLSMLTLDDHHSPSATLIPLTPISTNGIKIKHSLRTQSPLLSPLSLFTSTHVSPTTSRSSSFSELSVLSVQSSEQLKNRSLSETYVLKQLSSLSQQIHYYKTIIQCGNPVTEKSQKYDRDAAAVAMQNGRIRIESTASSVAAASFTLLTRRRLRRAICYWFYVVINPRREEFSLDALTIVNVSRSFYKIRRFSLRFTWIWTVATRWAFRRRINSGWSRWRELTISSLLIAKSHRDAVVWSSRVPRSFLQWRLAARVLLVRNRVFSQVLDHAKYSTLRRGLRRWWKFICFIRCVNRRCHVTVGASYDCWLQWQLYVLYRHRRRSAYEKAYDFQLQWQYRRRDMSTQSSNLLILWDVMSKWRFGSETMHRPSPSKFTTVMHAPSTTGLIASLRDRDVNISRPVADYKHVLTSL